MPRVNQVQLAAYLGVVKSRITYLKKTGRVTFDPDGLVDQDAAVAQINATRQPSNNLGTPISVSNAEKKGVIPPTIQAESASIPGKKQPTLLEARTYQTVQNGILAKIKVDVEKGLLINAEEAKKADFIAARKARDAILAIPLRVSAIIAAESDEFVVREMLTAELTKALISLSDGGILDG